MTPALGIALLLLATGAGLDLASVVQGLLSRPLVVAALTGFAMGEIEGALRVGAVLELFALDVVPVGASRYPDFGAATVAAVLYAAGTPWLESLGPAVGLGLVLATAGGATIPVVRRWNARLVRAFAGRLEEGSPAAVDRLHLQCLLHDLARSASVSALFLVTAWLASRFGLYPGSAIGPWLAGVAVAGGAWAAIHGALDAATSMARGRWLAGGVAVGVLMAVL